MNKFRMMIQSMFYKVMRRNAIFCMAIFCLLLLLLANTAAAQRLSPTDPPVSSPKLIEVASFGHFQPIGVAVAPIGNRIFVSFPHAKTFRYALVEITDGQQIPYPDAEWNRFVSMEDRDHFSRVQDLTVDQNNHLYVLDAAAGGGRQEGYFKLVKIDLTTNTVQKVYYFDDLPKNEISLNDVNIDNGKGLAYLSDPGSKALVVLNLKTGRSRIVLKNNPAMLASKGVVLHIDGKDVIDRNGNPFVSNVNGIALTPDNHYLYFRPINQMKLYRIATKALADTTLTSEALAKAVETVGTTGICHGMIADANGNIYLSVSPDHAIKYWSKEGQLHTLVKDPRIIWPDSFGIGSDGYLYFSCSQINRLPAFNGGKDLTAYPYKVYKVALPER